MATCFTERSQSLYKCDLTCDKLALWVGNEFAGLSGLAISAADTELFIPMRGMIQSLNLSVAAAVCLNEIMDDYVTTNSTLTKSQSHKVCNGRLSIPMGLDLRRRRLSRRKWCSLSRCGGAATVLARCRRRARVAWKEPGNT